MGRARRGRAARRRRRPGAVAAATAVGARAGLMAARGEVVARGHSTPTTRNGAEPPPGAVSQPPQAQFWPCGPLAAAIFGGLTGESPCLGASTTTIAPIFTRL